MKYLIAGTGGVGGSIAAFLKLAGEEVSCIARGKHLQEIRKNGLKIKSGLKGNHSIPIEAYSAEEFTGKADVIFVCVKGYSIDSILNLIRKASTPETIVIPILNVYGTGPKLQHLLPNITVLDGCIYIVGYISAPGEITQMGKVFRLVYGAHKDTKVQPGVLEAIQRDLSDSGIKAEISPDINRDTFIKWSFISAMACTGAYYDVPMGEVQKQGVVRNTFIGLSKESSNLGEQLGIEFVEDPIEYNLSIIDKLDPKSTASLQKDLAKGKDSEVEGLLFNMIAMGNEYNINMPVYNEIAKKFNI